MNTRGTQRERAVRDHLAKQDWIAFRAPASLGAADVIALRAGSRTQLIEVKSTAKGPYEHFGPAARTRLSLTAKLAGADALLAWWPPRGKLRFIARKRVATHMSDAQRSGGGRLSPDRPGPGQPARQRMSCWQPPLR